MKVLLFPSKFIMCHGAKKKLRITLKAYALLNQDIFLSHKHIVRLCKKPGKTRLHIAIK